MGPLEFIYYLGYSFKKSRSLKNQERLPHKVISVGNLTVGGTGKTPAVIAIAEEARKRGYLPCILTRGYKGKAKGPCFISKGKGPLLSVDQAGDEASLMAERLRGIPIVKGKNRYEAGIFALRNLRSEISNLKSQILFILDDGFQHWRLYRDMDILLIDSVNPFGNNKLLPSGILREPLSEIKRADIIVLTKTPDLRGKMPLLFSGYRSGIPARVNSDPADGPSLIDEIRKYNPFAPIYCSEHEPVSLRTFSGKDLPLNVLSGKAVLAFCGIGNPSSFKDTLLRMQAEVKEFIVFRDHHRYGSRDMERVRKIAGQCNAGWIVTTEKDIIRLKEFDLPENVLSLSIHFRIDNAFYGKIFSEG